MRYCFKGYRAFFPAVSLAMTSLFLAGNPAGAGQASPPEAQQGVKLTFEPGAAPALDSMMSSDGKILVRPKINDKEVGWFLFDPAVEGMRIAPSLAEVLELALSGTHRLISTSRAEDRRVWVCSVFGLGPCRVEGMELTEMKAAAGEEPGEAVVGVVGTALLRAVVAEVDFEKGAVRLYEPSAYDDTRTDWREFSLRNSLPVVRCRFEGDREGEFGLDLSSPLGIVFFKPAVDALGFLQNKVTRPGTISVANFGKAAVRTGFLEWFEAGGMRLEKARAVFLTEGISLAAAKDLTGLLGREALLGGVLVLDFSRSRLAVAAKGI